MVPIEQAQARIEAALAAGGTLVSDAAAPAFWVLADAEGNMACVCTPEGAATHPTAHGGIGVPDSGTAVTLG